MVLIIVLKDCVQVFVVCLKRENELQHEAENHKGVGQDGASWAVAFNLGHAWNSQFHADPVNVAKAEEELDHIHQNCPLTRLLQLIE